MLSADGGSKTASHDLLRQCHAEAALKTSCAWLGLLHPVGCLFSLCCGLVTDSSAPKPWVITRARSSWAGCRRTHPTPTFPSLSRFQTTQMQAFNIGNRKIVASYLGAWSFRVLHDPRVINKPLGAAAPIRTVLESGFQQPGPCATPAL